MSSLGTIMLSIIMDIGLLTTSVLAWLKCIYGYYGKPAAQLVAENAESYGWGNLTLAVQLLLPLALIALVFARKKIWIYPYPLLDTYISALCPSFSQQQRLLKWMSSRIPQTNNLPNKITQYWQNGSLLCTLINTVVPGACPNPQKHWKKPPTHGQALAYKYLGVAPVLTESDFNKQTLTSFSERKFIKYLLSIQEAINKQTIEEDSLKFTSKYVARGMGLVIGEQNRPSVFYIYPNTGSKTMENILVNIKGPYNTFGGEVISSVSPKISQDVKDLVKMRKDNSREQKKLAYKSKAQISFFRSVSFDIGPIMNLMGNRKNTGEILVKVEMENDRAKVIFLPKFSGIYELLLTNDGQHLQGSPFAIRVMKNNKELEYVLKEDPKLIKSKIERKIIGKSIDFINESVNITDEFYMKLDSNNNANEKDLKELNESNRSDDESTYQDSGIFDIDQSTNRSKLDLEEIDEDTAFSEISEANTTEESKSSSFDYTTTQETKEHLNFNNNEVIDLEHAEIERITVYQQASNHIKFLTENFDTHPENENFATVMKIAPTENLLSNDIIEEKMGRFAKNKSVDNAREIFNNAELQSNQEFENLYNKYANDDGVDESTDIKDDSDKLDKPVNLLDDKHEPTGKNVTANVEVTRIQNKITHTADASMLVEISQNVNSADFEVLSNIPQFQKGRKITSIERMVEIFEGDSCNKTQKPGIYVTVAEKKILQTSNFTFASPVLKDTAQEAVEVTVPVEDSAHLKRDPQLSSKEQRPILSREYSMCLDDEDIYDTNVKEIKSIFEKKQEVKTNLKKHDLQDSKKKLTKSLPNLHHENTKDFLEESDADDEFLVRFKEKKNFWNNLILQNSSSSLNVSTSDCTSNNTKLLSRKYQNVSQSTNSLNTYYRSNKLSTVNKWTRRKEELCKTTSLDLTKNYNDANTEDNRVKVTRAESLYDRIRIFDKDFDIDKHSTLLRRTKELSNLKEKPKYPDVLKPESLTEVPNTTSNDQVQEDLHFAEIMKERFEISRRYFSSLESLTVKGNLTRRHSMDSGTVPPKEIPLHKGGSLKVLNVLERFSLDNIYKDVVLSKLKNCNFKGSPNKEAVVETLSSVSSSENFDTSPCKEYMEEDDLNMQFFNIKKRLRKRRSIKSIFDVNY